MSMKKKGGKGDRVAPQHPQPLLSQPGPGSQCAVSGGPPLTWKGTPGQTVQVGAENLQQQQKTTKTNQDPRQTGLKKD